MSNEAQAEERPSSTRDNAGNRPCTGLHTSPVVQPSRQWSGRHLAHVPPVPMSCDRPRASTVAVMAGGSSL